MNREINVAKFKKLILEMYDGFPNSMFRDKVKEVVIASTVRKNLVDHGFLYDEEHANGTYYALGPNALALVSAWKTEELTEKIEKLTWAILILTGLVALPIIYNLIILAIGVFKIV